ncbi:acyl-CoA transferase [Mycobacterium tuberculosis]|nr:acyl-CoA transferase [Mycobacterium tuberculosis]
MPTSNPAKPLDGFRVLDFTQNVAGPLAGQVLGDLGAEVIKVEAPGGEAARQITSVLPGRPPLATYFLPNNRGKKSVTVDLTTEQAKQQMLRLADTADVVLEAFRPGTMEKLGLGPDDLRSRNPNLIYARLTAYGGNGPHGSRPGIDLVVAAEAGMTTGMPTPEGSHRSSHFSSSTTPAVTCWPRPCWPRCCTASGTGWPTSSRSRCTTSRWDYKPTS